MALDDHADVAEILIAWGAHVNAKARDGNTPLHSAAFYGSKKVVRALLEHGADPNLKNNEGLTPSEVAEGNAHKEVKDIIDNFRTHNRSFHPTSFQRGRTLRYDKI